MSVGTIWSTPSQGPMQSYFQQRQADLAQLGKALNAGNEQEAQQDFNAIVSLGQQGPFADGAAFGEATREQDFEQIGQALQNGDMASATQAYQALEATFHTSQQKPQPEPLQAQPLQAQPLQSQPLQSYFQQRQADLAQLGQALNSGNEQEALQDFNAIVSLGQQGPFADGAAFGRTNREQDFDQIGQALQNGDMASAAQAYQTLEATFHTSQLPQPVPLADTGATTNSVSGSDASNT